MDEPLSGPGSADDRERPADAGSAPGPYRRVLLKLSGESFVRPEIGRAHV